MKISIYIDSKDMGGIESHILQLILGLIESTQYDIELLFWKNYHADSQHPLVERLIQADAFTHNRCRVIHIGESIVSLLNFFKSNTSLIHSHGYKAGISARIFGLFTNTPIVSTYHNGDPGSGKLKLYNFIDKITSFLSVNIAVNESIATSLKRCSVIPNFVNTMNKDLFLNALEKRYEVAFVGRLSHEKGPDIFANITKNLNYSIALYGDGPMMKALKQQFIHIEFKGMCNMEKCWKNIRILVMPSRYEGLPLAALEAMARGIPVIASTAGALPKLINDCGVGKTIALENIPKFRAEIESAMQQNNTLYAKQGGDLIDYININYSRKNNIEKIVNIYKHALSLQQ